MLELDFIENILKDCYKDHVKKSYHFTMIKRVNKGFDSTKGEEGLFHIEFNNEKWNYKCVAPN